jgi:lysozyme
MKTTDQGRKKIQQREGVKLEAYRDSVGVLTIGVGHTSMAGPPTVKPGMKITAAEADEILSRDLGQFEVAVNKLVHVPLAPNEFDALVSLAFNIGVGNFGGSTLLRRLNAGDKAGAANAFLSWVKAGGKTLKGLVNRRQDERKQFLTAY